MDSAKLVFDSTGIDSDPGIGVGINSAEPNLESESIPPMNDRFRPPMIQSGQFVPNTYAQSV